MHSLSSIVRAAGAALLLVAGSSAAHATLYGADNLTDGSLNGVVTFDNNLNVTSTFLTSGPIAGITATQTSIFASLPTGVAKYMLDGTLVQTYANIGTDHFGALSTHNGVVYAADNLSDGSLHGVVIFDFNLNVTNTFLTSGSIAGLAADGVGAFTSLPTGVSQYDTTGTVLQSYPNIGTDQFGALSLAGGLLYAADNLSDGSLHGVVTFDGSLGVVGTFLTPGYIAGLAADGSNVFLSLPDGISEFTATGSFVRRYDNIGTDGFGALALAPGIPEPASWAMMVAGLGLVGAAMRRRHARPAHDTFSDHVETGLPGIETADRAGWKQVRKAA